MSKRKEAIHPPVVYVEWVDSAHVNSTWEDQAKVAKEGIRFASDPIVASGFLMANTKEAVVLSMALNHHSDHATMTMSIPRAAVKRMVEVRRKKGYKAVKP